MTLFEVMAGQRSQRIFTRWIQDDEGAMVGQRQIRVVRLLGVKLGQTQTSRKPLGIERDSLFER